MYSPSPAVTSIFFERSQLLSLRILAGMLVSPRCSPMSASPSLRPSGSCSGSSHSQGRLIVFQMYSLHLVSTKPMTSFSIQRVCITISLPPGWIRDWTDGPISLCILAMTVSDCAASLFLIGSSIIKSSAPYDVMPALSPAALQRPPLDVSHKPTPCTASLGLAPKMSSQYSLNLSRFLRLKPSAIVPSYEQIITESS